MGIAAWKNSSIAALAPLLYVDEELAQIRAVRDPVVRATPSARAQTKKNVKHSHGGFALRSFHSLLGSLATLCANACRVGTSPNAVRFLRPTEANACQKEIFRLLGVKLP